MENLLKLAKKYPDPWSENLLDFLSEELGIKKSTLNLLLPRGLEELVDYYLLQIESSLIVTRDDSIQTRVYQLLLSIFLKLEEEKDFSLKLLAAPLSITKKIQMIWRGAQKIWDLVDISSDLSYYTRTASLASIYSRNLLVFREDDDWRSSLQSDFQKLGKLIKLKKSFSVF